LPAGGAFVPALPPAGFVRVIRKAPREVSSSPLCCAGRAGDRTASRRKIELKEGLTNFMLRLRELMTGQHTDADGGGSSFAFDDDVEDQRPAAILRGRGDD